MPEIETPAIGLRKYPFVVKELLLNSVKNVLIKNIIVSCCLSKLISIFLSQDHLISFVGFHPASPLMDITVYSWDFMDSQKTANSSVIKPFLMFINPKSEKDNLKHTT